MSSSTSIPDTLGVGVVGVGLMGRTHARAYQRAIDDGYPARLVALCDRAPERFDAEGRALQLLPGEDKAPLFDPKEVELLTDATQLFARSDVQLVSICTHTDSHVDLAIAALEAGKSVLLEKPVALSSSEVERLIEVARRSQGFCMPAMCMRFWPGWSWLKPIIAANKYGRVLSASFRRQCAPPDWAPEFYGDPSKNGGALFDLHIHDADLVRWLFGAPDLVQSYGDLDHMTSFYGYHDGPAHVSAQGGWNHSPGFPFQMHFSVIFEHATAEYCSTREVPLLLYQNGQAKPLQLDMSFASGYDGEIIHALDVCHGAKPALALEETLELTRMLEVERAQLEKRS